MAGAGKKTFTAGEVLTASDVNTYLMEQSVMYFGGTAARASAIPTPSTGMTTYIGTTGTASIPQIETYTGSQWETPYGHTLVASVTIPSTVAAVAIDNCFSSRFDEYIVYVSGFASSTVDALLLQMRDGSGNVGGSSYNMTGIEKINDNTFTSRLTLNSSSWRVGTTGSSGGGHYQTIRVSSPFLTRNTAIHSSSVATVPASVQIVWNEFAGTLLTSASYTGLNLLIATGGQTLSDGKIRVFGVRN
jgi:hypothetical protein